MGRTSKRVSNRRSKKILLHYKSKKKGSLFLKRVFDVIVSLIMLIILLPGLTILGIAIKIDSKGPVFFRQVIITQYGRTFRIFKN